MKSRSGGLTVAVIFVKIVPTTNTMVEGDTDSVLLLQRRLAFSLNDLMNLRKSHPSRHTCIIFGPFNRLGVAVAADIKIFKTSLGQMGYSPPVWCGSTF